MALLLKDKTYVKFEPDGTFYIYDSKSARNKAKKATNPDAVLAKYGEVIGELSDPVRQYYSPEDRKNLKAWKEEASKYMQALSIYDVDGHYPLMEQYIKDVDATIPKIRLSARFPKLAAEAGHSLEEIYKRAKEEMLFGEAKDC